MIVGLRPRRSARKPSNKAPAAMPAMVAYWKAPASVRLNENSRMISGMTLPTASDFEALAASTSGQDLTSFFTAWLRTPGKPARTADNGLA